jgi:hypothetical protein
MECVFYEDAIRELTVKMGALRNGCWREQTVSYSQAAPSSHERSLVLGGSMASGKAVSFTEVLAGRF